MGLKRYKLIPRSPTATSFFSVLGNVRNGEQSRRDGIVRAHKFFLSAVHEFSKDNPGCEAPDCSLAEQPPIARDGTIDAKKLVGTDDARRAEIVRRSAHCQALKKRVAVGDPRYQFVALQAICRL